MVLAAIGFFTDYWLPLRGAVKRRTHRRHYHPDHGHAERAAAFLAEYPHQQSGGSAKSMVRTTATVLRHRQLQRASLTLEIADPRTGAGDIIQLSAGDMVPADVHSLSPLARSVHQPGDFDRRGDPLSKIRYDGQRGAEVERRSVSENALLELSNICLMGTNVASGTATAVMLGGDRQALTSARWPKSSGHLGADCVRSRGEQRQLAVDSSCW